MQLSKGLLRKLGAPVSTGTAYMFHPDLPWLQSDVKTELLPAYATDPCPVTDSLFINAGLHQWSVQCAVKAQVPCLYGGYPRMYWMSSRGQPKRGCPPASVLGGRPTTVRCKHSTGFSLRHNNVGHFCTVIRGHWYTTVIRGHVLNIVLRQWSLFLFFGFSRYEFVFKLRCPFTIPVPCLQWSPLQLMSRSALAHVCGACPNSDCG